MIVIDPFEYEIVTIVENSIKTLEDLRGSRLCHPGYGYEADWTDTLANVWDLIKCQLIFNDL